MAKSGPNIPVGACPSCGDIQDHANDVAGTEPPVPGDLAICLSCGYISKFDDAMGRRDLTPEEFAAIPDDQLLEISRIEQARVELRARMPRRPRP